MLTSESNSFLKQLEENNLFDLAKNPFFLNHLIEIFKKDKKIPITRSKIFSRIISLAIECDEKKLTNKYDLKQNYPASEIRKDLRYISLIMEILQRNFITVEELNKIISDKTKRQIITELSLIKKSFFKEGSVYQFQHNNFQEYLAAEILADQNLNAILDFITFRSIIKREISWMERFVILLEYIDFKPFGIKIDRLISTLLNLIRYKRIDKINPSWVNTVAFLCQLRKGDDLLNYLMKNEPELTLKFEISRIDVKKREELFKAIFKKYTDREIWIDRNIDYEEMANFGKTKGIYEFLMKYARSKKHFIHRYNAIQMLGMMKGLEDESLRHLLIEYAKDENENKKVRHISLYALSWLGMASSDTIDALKHLKYSNDDWVLSGLYYLIKESPHTDQYVDILLEGIPQIRFWFNSTKPRLANERWNLMSGIEKIQSVEGIKKIIRHFIDNPRDLGEFYIERSIGKIVSNIIKAYEYNASIYDDTKELLRVASKEHIDKTITEILVFFQKTGTALNFFKEVYEEGIENNYYLLATLADEKCIDFLISQYSQGKLTDDNIWTFIKFLSWRNREEESLLKIINEKTNNKFLPPPPRDYQKEKKERTKRELEIIFDKKEFLKEVQKIFDGEGKEKISFNDIENLLFERYAEDRYNGFVMRELQNFFEQNVDKNKKWKLEDLINEINQLNYEWFTIRRVFNLLYDVNENELELSEGHKVVIKDFCFKNLKEANFKDALKPKDNRATPNYLAIMLWYFLRKFNFEYPEEILLDMLSFDWIDGHQFVGIDYLENRLPSEKIKDRILDNLNKGIKVSQVLKNHINYCKKHNLTEAKEQLFNIIKNPEIEMENRLLALETVASFPDTTTFLEEMLDIDEVELFINSAEILMNRGNRKSKGKLLHKLSSENEKIALESAKLLIKEQDLKAIRFYCNYIKRTKKFEVDFHDKNPLQQIKTIKALPILFDLLKFSYEFRREIQQDEIHRLDSIIIGVLKNIALQSFSNFTKVMKRMQKFIKKYHSRLEGINFLNIASDEIEKTFFINYPGQITVDDAIEKVQKLYRKKT